MATAPNLVVAGDPGVARKLRETGRFPAVHDAASAAELRDLSRSGRVGSPTAFMFAPGFVEDLPGAGVAVLANGLAASGFTVLVHGYFTERGDVFDPKVRVTGRQLRLSELLATLGVTDAAPARPQAAQEPASAQTSAAPAQPQAAATPPAQTTPAQTTPAESAPAESAVQPFAQQGPDQTARSAAQPPAQTPAQPPAFGQAPAQQPAAQQPQAVQQPAHQPPAQQPAAQQHGALQPVVQHQGTPAPVQGQQAWPAPVQQPQPVQQPHPGYETAAAQNGGWTGHQQQQQAITASSAPALEAPPRPGQVIAIASAKGGVGKTSTAVNLAVYAARHLHAAGRTGRVALVDTNFQQADVGRYLNIESPTILEVLRENGSLTPENVRNLLAYSADVDLYTLLGPPDVVKADPAVVNAVVYKRILAVLRKSFDYIFVDTPVAELYHTTFTDLILPEADAILVPVEPNRVTLEAARAWLRAITMPQVSRSGGVPPEKLSLILNRARADVDCGPEEVMDLMPGWRFVGMIPDDQEWTQATNNRRLNSLQAGPDLEATFREILLSVTGDQVFATPMTTQSSGGKGGLLKRILGLNPK